MRQTLVTKSHANMSTAPRRRIPYVAEWLFIGPRSVLAHALLVLSYLAGGPAIAVPLVPLVGVVAAATLREQILARWTGWLGVVTALCGAACASTFLGPTNNRSATYGILLLGAVLMFAWLVVTSISLIARMPEESHSAG